MTAVRRSDSYVLNQRVFRSTLSPLHHRIDAFSWPLHDCFDSAVIAIADPA